MWTLTRYYDKLMRKSTKREERIKKWHSYGAVVSQKKQTS